jgi:hypothetical protein
MKLCHPRWLPLGALDWVAVGAACTLLGVMFHPFLASKYSDRANVPCLVETMFDWQPFWYKGYELRCGLVHIAHNDSDLEGLLSPRTRGLKHVGTLACKATVRKLPILFGLLDHETWIVALWDCEPHRARRAFCSSDGRSCLV